MTKPLERLHDEYALSVLNQAPQLAKVTQRPPLINMGVGQPNFAVDTHIRQAAARASQEQPFGYSPAKGRPKILGAISEYCKNNLDYQPEESLIVATPGGKGGIFMVMTSLLSPGDEVLIPAPSFPAYASCAAFCQAKVVPVPLARDRLDVRAEDYAPYITKETKLLILNTPSNPTGGMMPANELAALAKILEDYPECLVLSDEVYARLTLSDLPHCSAYTIKSWRERLFLIDSLSKSFAMTGWRFGWVIAPKGYQDLFNRYLINSHSNLPGIVEYAALAALTGPQDSVMKRNLAYRNRAEIFYQAMKTIPQCTCHHPLGAFYSYVEVKSFHADRPGALCSDIELSQKLTHEEGVLTVPGHGFSQPNGRFLRFSLAVSDEQVTEAVQRIQSFFLSNPGS